MEEIQKACRLGETDLLESIIQAHPESVNQLDTKLGWAPLYRTVICGHIEASHCLLQHSADPNIKNRLGEAPLHQAADNNQLDIAELLLKFGAEVNIQQNDGDSPIHLAAFKGHADMVSLLISHKADPNLQNFVFGKTPLHSAAENTHLTVVKALLQANARRDLTDRTGKRPVDLAKSSEVQSLLNAEPDEPNHSHRVLEEEPSKIPVNKADDSDGKIERLQEQLRSEYEPECEKVLPQDFGYRTFSFGGDICKNTLYLWLLSNRLESLFEALFNSGFDDLDLLISHQALNLEILEQIGIEKPGLRMRLLALLEEEAAKNKKKSNKETRISCWVSPVPAVGFVICPTFDEWLQKLNLEYLKPMFQHAGLDDMEHLILLMNSRYPLTDLILEQDVGIDKIGHRHRLLASLKEEASRSGKNEISIERVANNTACEMCLIS